MELTGLSRDPFGYDIIRLNIFAQIRTGQNSGDFPFRLMIVSFLIPFFWDRNVMDMASADWSWDGTSMPLL